MNTQLPDLPRKDRLLRERSHDPYKPRHKLPEPTVCPRCKAVYHGGRWQWAKSWPLGSHQELCQACTRIRDGYPAGIMTLGGGFVPLHRDELIHLARRIEAEETAEHPLHRIIKIEEHPDTVIISTTDIHLPRRIGEALHHAYKGNLDLQYSAESCYLRARWSREAPVERILKSGRKILPARSTKRHPPGSRR